MQPDKVPKILNCLCNPAQSRFSKQNISLRSIPDSLAKDKYVFK